MALQVVARLIPGAAAVVGALLLILWLGSAPDAALTERIPMADATIEQESAVVVRGTLVAGGGMPAELPGEWPCFRGPNRDGICTDPTPLAKSWPESGPPVLWSLELGEGYAGAAVRAGRVYVLDYDQVRRADVLRCLSLKDGREIWSYSYGVEVKRNHGMSRTMPALGDRHVVALGPKCHVTCLDAESGEHKWALDLVRSFGAKVPPWYAGQCPLIDGQKVILAPGGESALLMAVDIETGSVLWKTPNPNGWTMTHSSILPLEFNGRRMYVYCASGGVVGVSADDGRLLWQTTDWRISIANVPTPVDAGDGRIFLSGGYNAGCMMLRLEENDGAIAVQTLFRLKPREFGSDQQTPVFRDGVVYGVIPGGELACLGLDGKRRWTSGSAQRFGLGPYMFAGGMMLLMDDSGVLTLADVTPDGLKTLASAKVLHGHESWGPITIAGGLLIVRDLTSMVCLDLRENQHGK
ncbi:MAG TPA: PQQ-binding-like beta-propeller repeat protein [Planctomycetota bacterium]|nr:PQQ-binding-like beta-propeller repeat protein [Planctomycetota bacterium]